MSASDRDAFLAWYRDASRGVFDFKKEALKYCRQDVDILAEGCLRFRDQFVKDTQVDPFSCITIASACTKVFRTNFLTPQTLAVPPPDDYRRRYGAMELQETLHGTAMGKTDNIFIAAFTTFSLRRLKLCERLSGAGFQSSAPERPEVEPLRETERPEEDEAMSEGPLLRTFYDSVVASAIFYGIVCWASSITDRDRRRMDRLAEEGHWLLHETPGFAESACLVNLVFLLASSPPLQSCLQHSIAAWPSALTTPLDAGLTPHSASLPALPLLRQPHAKPFQTPTANRTLLLNCYQTAENQKLFTEFVEHCSAVTQDCPEVLTFLQTKRSKASPDYLSSVEFRNTLGRCLTRAQANRSKIFVYINELCAVLKQHAAKQRQNITKVESGPCTSTSTSSPLQSTSVTPKSKHRTKVEMGEEEEVKPSTEEKQPSALELQEDNKNKEEEVEKKAKRASRKQIAYLENLLNVYNEEIRRLQQAELNLDDLETEESSYIQEHKLKRKMMKIYEKLCELKGCNTLTGRVIEQRISYSSTCYPEINRRIERFINSLEAQRNPPDY
ncbi:hypothetical protein L3Q82_003297 [Scortum barcoo]|uniref:Uncharacterized protein n=1 Tax=Scortum barcoo TaxID=214431 RepID=A0ACB8VM25_9TELE|nr:hypothetical protein L3Q82_003297 [Scortum barcoo]